MIALVLVCSVLCLDGNTQRSDWMDSANDLHFEIRSGRPERPKRPDTASIPELRSASDVQQATAAEFVPGSTESIRILRVRDTEEIDAVLSKRFSLLGVNAFPKFSIHPRVRNYGGIAYPLVRALLEDETVTVEYGEESELENGYVSVYIFLPDGRMINTLLVENGLAFLEKQYKELKYGDKLYKALQEAKKKKLGYWSRGRKE